MRAKVLKTVTKGDKPEDEQEEDIQNGSEDQIEPTKSHEEEKDSPKDTQQQKQTDNLIHKSGLDEFLSEAMMFFYAMV